MARTAAAIFLLLAVFWTAAAWFAPDRGPIVTREPPAAFAQPGRHHLATGAG